MDLGLAGKTALVLGASRGLGASVARALVHEGASVVAAARNVDDIAVWAATLPVEQQQRVTGMRLDISDLAACQDCQVAPIDDAPVFALGRCPFAPERVRLCGQRAKSL